MIHDYKSLILNVQTRNLDNTLKGIVHPKMKIIPWFIDLLTLKPS